MPSKISQVRKRPIIQLIRRQESWVFTAQGWGLAIAFAISLVIFAITHIHPFLTVTSPIKADVLVVEGWIPDYALKQALTEFNNGSYHQIVTTGVPLPTGFYLSEYKNYAELSAATLQALGLEKQKLVAVPAPNVIKDRTKASAIAFRQWLLNSNERTTINLFTFDAHARRSWLLFKQILAPIQVGVIAVESQDYDSSKWWSSSEGVRETISETIAYIYARFLNWKS